MTLEAIRQFDANDPMISAAARVDRVIYAQGTLTVPLPNQFSGSVGVLYTNQVSNYDLDTYDDLSVQVALMICF